MSNYIIPTKEDEIQSKTGLKKWIRGRAEAYQEHLNNSGYRDLEFDQSNIAGIQYVSKTISYDSNEGFIQNGNGPNYFGGVYTLATCRYDIRGTSERHGGWDFDEHFRSVPGESDLFLPKYPVLVFNTTKTTSNGFRRGRWISSIAFITHAFKTVNGYAEHLLEQFDGEAVSHRLTRAKDAPAIAINHGDCHSDRDGIVGGPPEGHPHHEGTRSTCGCGSEEDELHSDNDDDHLKVLSLPDYWMSFTDTVFENTVGGRGHSKIESWDLEDISEVQ